MPKTIFTPPFFISVLSVLAVLLIWQDVTAQQRSNRSRQTVEPVAPAEAPAEAEPAKKPVVGTITVDGETRSIVNDYCRAFPGGGGKIRVDGRGKDDAGSILRYVLHSGKLQIRHGNAMYYSSDRDGKIVFQVDGSKVTLDGMFATDNQAKPDHSIQMSFNCGEPAQEPVIGTTTAQKPVIGTMTVDGETRSIVIEDCKVLPGGGERIRVDGAGKDDAGSTLSYTFSYGRFNIRTSTGRYMTRDRDGKMVFQVDGSKVTLDGMFATDSKARPDHSIQLSFDCTG